MFYDLQKKLSKNGGYLEAIEESDDNRFKLLQFIASFKNWSPSDIGLEWRDFWAIMPKIRDDENGIRFSFFLSQFLTYVLLHTYGVYLDEDKRKWCEDYDNWKETTKFLGMQLGEGGFPVAHLDAKKEFLCNVLALHEEENRKKVERASNSDSGE